MKTSAELQQHVYDELKWDMRITEGDIGVSVKDAVVTLSGTIPNFAEKWAAEDAAKKVCGVAAVVNKIEVKLAGSHVKDDQDIAKTARMMLTWNIWIPENVIHIVVENAFVTLSGTVASDHQRKTAENVIRFLPGVRGVLNEITVAHTVTAKDIQQQIKRALHRHAEKDANNISVDVKDGEVSLSGTVNSWTEKTEAEWAAHATAGVRAVKNDVKVSSL